MSGCDMKQEDSVPVGDRPQEVRRFPYEETPRGIVENMLAIPKILGKGGLCECGYFLN